MINLQIFCSNERTNLEEPFVDNGFEYATDGKILIAVKTDKPDSEDRHPKNTQQLFERVWDESWEPIKIRWPDRTEHKCCFCNGDGLKRHQCNICEGFGRHTCDCGTEHDCGYCDGEGYSKCEDSEICPECEGTGKAFENQKYGFRYFLGSLIAKIVNNLPNPKVTEMSTGSGCLRFEFDGGKGLLMGMKEDSYERS